MDKVEEEGAEHVVAKELADTLQRKQRGCAGLGGELHGARGEGRGGGEDERERAGAARGGERRGVSLDPVSYAIYTFFSHKLLP